MNTQELRTDLIKLRIGTQELERKVSEAINDGSLESVQCHLSALTTLSQVVNQLEDAIFTLNPTVELLVFIAISKEWGVNKCGDGIIELQKYSDAGQDFNFQLQGTTPGELINDLEEYIFSFDPLYEASLWVGQDGHGRNGAPDDPRDIVADMEDCKGMMRELLDAWKQL